MKNPWTRLSMPLVMMWGSLVASAPAIAQSTHTETLSPERAMLLMQNEAAIYFNTFAGNTEVPVFNSNQNGPMLVGYSAVVRLKETTSELSCSIDLNEVVQCAPPSPGIITPPVTDNRCGPERPQETILDTPFTQNLFSTVNDYSVRIYYNIDVVANVKHLCMNVYDVRNESFIGALPARAATSFNTTAYYGEQPLDGVDHQVILNPDGRYIFRRSEGATLLYEGFSR